MEVQAELESLLLKTFRTGTLFTLSYDLLVTISKKKKNIATETVTIEVPL